MLNWNSSVLRIVASLSTLAIIAIACPVFAQNAAPPPVREMIDDNGVDLLSGRMTSVYGGPSIGPDGAGSAFVRQFRADGIWDNFGGAISGGEGSFSVTLNGVTEIFAEEPAGVFTPAENVGSTLTFAGDTYTYTTRNGTVALYQDNIPTNAYWTGDGASLMSITYPSGERTTFAYQEVAVCYTPTCTQQGTGVRLVSFTNNRGYEALLSYAAPDGNGFTQSDVAFLPTQIVFVNLANGVTVGSISILREYLGNGLVRHTLTDALGRTTVYRVTNSFGITSIRWPGSAIDNITVTYAGIKVSSINNNGVVTNYAYSENAGDQLTTVTRPGVAGSRVIRYALSGHVLSDKDELNRTTSYSYDAQVRLSRVTAPEGNFVEYTYEARGNITQTLVRAKPASGLADIITTANFDATCTNPKTCNQPNWTRDARGHQTDYTYDPTHGGVLTVTLPAPTAGAVRPQTRYSYTALEAWYLNTSGVLAASGQPIHLLTGTSTCRTLSSCLGGADESKMVIAYGSSGVANNRWPVAITSSDGSGTLAFTVTLAYDAVGNVLTVDGPLAGTADTTRTRYDALRRIVGIVSPDPDGSGLRTPVATRNTYNTAGRLVTLEKGTVNSQSDADWASFVAFESVSFEHDGAGRRIKSSLSAGGTTYAVEQMSYDAVGRPLCAATRMNSAVFASLPGSACTHGTMGSHGPDRITQRTYDAAGQVTRVTMGYGTGNPIDVITTSYTPNGRVGTVSDGRGYLTTFEYDGFDRPFKTRFPNLTTPGTSSTTDYEQHTYDVSSNVVFSRVRNGQTITLWLDNLDRLVLKDLPVGSSEDAYLGYDNQGRVLSARFGSPTGAGVVNTYDGLGRLSTRTSFGRTLGYAQDAAGRRTRVTHPDGFYAEYSYNPAGELTAITDSTGTTLASYTYDALSRRNGIGRASGAGTGYSYDAVSRLAALTQDLAGTNYDGTTTFTHTPSAQLASRTQSNDATYGWMPTTNSSVGMAHNGLNQLTQVGSTAAGHDQLGNLETGESTFTYGYDLENRMRSAVAGSTTISLAYDPLGLLSGVTSNGTTTEFLYDGLDLVAEYNSSGAVLRRYVHGVGMDEPLVWYEGSGTADRRYLHADERGSIVAISSSSGAGLESFKYSPDGESTNAANSRFGYTGQVWLAQLGLYYYKSRMYSPKLGRFLQSDVIGYGGGMNLYAYVGGDPINWVDPFGYEEERPTWADLCQKLPSYCTRGDPAAGSIMDRDIHTVDAHARQEPYLHLPISAYGRVNLDQYSAEELTFLALDIADFGLARLENNLIEMNVLSDPDILEAGGASRLLRPQVVRDILKFGRKLVGREFPVKPNRGGFQPFDPMSGKYLPHSANPGLALSPLGRFSSGVASGFAETKGVSGPAPVGRAGAIGYELGRLLGIFN